MIRIALLAVLLACAHAQTCEPEVECEFTQVVDGKSYFYDFISLCKNGGGDYFFADDKAHDYYANVCGTASQICLPLDWDNVYERGVAVQLWGDEPPCDPNTGVNMNCTDNSFQPPVPACCTRPCQVLGVGKPTFNLHRSGDPSDGIEMTFTGAVPAADDPYWCPWNTKTNSQYPRTVTYLMDCDPTVDTAVGILAQQNSTEDCDYKLTFKTKHACPATSSSSLSGGWIFIIILVVLAVVYFGGGFLYTYHKERVWAPPNRGFWSAFGSYIGDGVSFIMSGCRGLGAAKASGASPYDEIGSSSAAASSSAAPSAYNASSSTTAYTDL